MHRSAPVFFALRWGAALALAASALAHRAVACPLSRDECAGVVSELSQLRGDQLARLRQGERVLEIRDIEQDGARRIQVEGALVVAAPPALAWSVVTDFRSWPAFIPHLARVELHPLGPESSSVLLHQDTRVFGFELGATTQRWIDGDQRILWDRLAPDPHNGLDALSGFWQVLDLGDGRSLLRFQSRVGLAASLPDALESWLIERGAPDALAAFAAEIERRQRAV